jgi:hypothetical protein
MSSACGVSALVSFSANLFVRIEKAQLKTINFFQQQKFVPRIFSLSIYIAEFIFSVCANNFRLPFMISVNDSTP